MSHWLKYITILIAATFTFCGPAAAQQSLQSGNCNFCLPCTVDGEDGIRTTDEGVSIYDILYLNQPECMAYAEGCENLIECSPDLASLNLPEVLDRDVREFAELMRENRDQVELVPSRNVVLFRNSCSKVVQLREVTAGEMAYLQSQQE